MDIASVMSFMGWLGFLLASFTISLWVIVVVHEYGHYIVARWTGIHADVFSLGMGPTLLSRTDRRGTVWRLALLPIGGYVKFKGDANVSSFATQEETPPDPTTFAGAPIWARALTVAAGPAFNFILAVLLFGGLAYMHGDSREVPVVSSIKDAPYEVAVLQPGDRILSINGMQTATTEDLIEVIDGLKEGFTAHYEVLRDKERIEVEAAHPRYPIVTAVMPNSPARSAGLMVGDVLLRADGEKLASLVTLTKIIGDGSRSIAVDYWRDGTEYSAQLKPLYRDLQIENGFESRPVIGVSSNRFFNLEKSYPGPVAAIGKGAERVVNVVHVTFIALRDMMVGAISTCNIAGPVGMAVISSDMASDGFDSFIAFIAVLSVAVGFFNLLPIPVLDGGHLVFHAWEALLGRPPNRRVAEVMMQVGLTVILGFMVFALGHDLFCT